MLLEFEPIAAVRAFVERGGDVLLLIAAVTFLMWTLMLERLWYFKVLQPRETRRVEAIWRTRTDHDSWFADQVRRLLVSEVRLELHHSVGAIKTLVALCPMLGLLGTVTGMIEVFHTIAEAGAGQAAQLSGGISQALITTATGLLIAIPSLVAHNFFHEKAQVIVTDPERESLRVLRGLYRAPEATEIETPHAGLRSAVKE